ncbi:MAG: hypothetical protein KC620_27255, partial [Myxococcales bacterium]|nr:hypothetical protein [Myxococcales bacterium]
MTDAPAASAAEPEAPDALAGLHGALARARGELAALAPKTLDDGSWFHIVLKRAAERLLTRQRRRTDLEGWRTRHPELADPALADRMIRQASRRAALVGATSGAL